MDHEVVEPALALVEDVLAVEEFAEEDEVLEVHDGDVGVGRGDLVVHAAGDGELVEVPEEFLLCGGELVAVLAPDERAVLHAEFDGVGVEDDAVLE